MVHYEPTELLEKRKEEQKTMTVDDIINELKKSPCFEENMKALEKWEKKVKKIMKRRAQ